MVAVKVKRNTYGGTEYLQKACKYVLNPSKAISTGGYGVSHDNAPVAFNQMMCTKAYFNKTSGNPLVHLVLSYDKTVDSAEKASELSRQNADYFSNDYQVLYCTHNKDTNCSHYHTHMIINSVSYTNGMMFNSSIENMKKFCNYVSDVTGRPSRLYFKD